MTERDLTDARLLIVDDQEANVELLERLLEQWGYLNVISTTDSAKALDLCAATDPDLVLLDLHMPAPDGFEVMAGLQSSMMGDVRLPVLVLTADATQEPKHRALALGARDFVTKPFDPVEVRLRVENLLQIRRFELELTDQNDVLEQRVKERTRRLDHARLETLSRLAIAAEYRDDDTHEHANRVGEVAARLAVEMGASAEESELIRLAAPLHDIGKIGISDSILLKPGRLTAAEFDVMKSHAVIGGKILSGGTSEVVVLSESIALTHHERWDGSGYPHGLAGMDIPLAGRTTAVADVFDALTHARPYKEAWPLEQAEAEIRRGAGTHFDPAVVDAFDRLRENAAPAPAPAPASLVPEPSVVAA